ncbi:MAG: colanic acid exporter [Syntrophorhabdus sp. PtaU1.Bin153]|nr:MAG: colanic acid exporter [Syntrophorhabdus sp. PtaU1.Bin153]
MTFAQALQLIRRDGFIRNVFTLIGGTAVAQMIPVAVSPILTRFYSPGDYGLLALFTSISSVVGVLATLRYDTAIMLPADDNDAAGVLSLSVIATLAITLLTLIIAIAANSYLAGRLNKPEITPWLYFVPLAVLFTGASQAFSGWSNRKKQYKRLALNKVLGGGSTTATNLTMGAMNLSVNGLITGSLTGQGISAGYLGWQIWSDERGGRYHINMRRLKRQLVRYIRFPLYSLPADFVNAAAQQSPILLISNSFGAVAAGQFFLVQRVLGMPITLIASSILSVFRERASRDYMTYGNCTDIFIKTLRGLFLCSITPFLLFFFTAPLLFSLVFGPAWREAGNYAQILSVLFFVRFIASPLTYVMYIVEKQNYDLAGQILLFISTLLSVMAGAHYGNIRVALLSFSASYSLIYLLYLLISYRLAKGTTTGI